VEKWRDETEKGTALAPPVAFPGATNAPDPTRPTRSCVEGRDTSEWVQDAGPRVPEASELSPSGGEGGDMTLCEEWDITLCAGEHGGVGGRPRPDTEPDRSSQAMLESQESAFCRRPVIAAPTP